MKSLLIFTMLFSIQAFALNRYLVPCEDGSGVCNVGASVQPKDTICQVPDDQDGSLYKIEVYKDELSLVEKALEFVGIQSEKVKDWDGSPLEQGEFIECSIDSSKVAAKEAARVAAEAAEKAKKDKETSDFAAACAETKDPVSVLVCKERGFQASK